LNETAPRALALWAFYFCSFCFYFFDLGFVVDGTAYFERVQPGSAARSWGEAKGAVSKIPAEDVR